MLTRKIKQKKPGTPWADSFDKQEAQDLPKLSLEKITRKSVYKSILNECKDARPANADKEEGDSNEEKKPEAEKPKPKSKKPAMAKYSPLDQEYLDLIYGKDEESSEDQRKAEQTADDHEEAKKKGRTERFEKIKAKYPIVAMLTMFLTDFHKWLDLNDESGLAGFVEKYKDSEVDAVAQFVNGLVKDYDAVLNCLRYPHISNGPIEGVNTRTKSVHRRGGGRASVELLCAFRVLAS